MPEYIPGRHSIVGSSRKISTTQTQRPLFNNLTRRNVELVETMPMRAASTCLQSANIKSIRLFRHICRMLPFILRIHELHFRVEPVQAKRYVANFFRDEAKVTDLKKIDFLVQYGYETVYEAEMDYCNAGYLYRFVMPPQHNMRDQGIDKFSQQKAGRINEIPGSSFLNSFYRGHKSHCN